MTEKTKAAAVDRIPAPLPEREEQRRPGSHLLQEREKIMPPEAMETGAGWPGESRRALRTDVRRRGGRESSAGMPMPSVLSGEEKRTGKFLLQEFL